MWMCVLRDMQHLASEAHFRLRASVEQSTGFSQPGWFLFDSIKF